MLISRAVWTFRKHGGRNAGCFDEQDLLDRLTALVDELERRKALLSGTSYSNIDEYNLGTGAHLARYIFACDEIAEVLDKTGDHDQHLRRIADRCLSDDPRKRFRDVPDLKMALSGKSNKRLYMLIIAFLLLMTVILGYLSIKNPML